MSDLEPDTRLPREAARRAPVYLWQKLLHGDPANTLQIFRTVDILFLFSVGRKLWSLPF